MNLLDFSNWKQSSGGVLMKSVLQSNFIEITLRHGCSPLNLLHIFRTPFPNNTSGRLHLSNVINNKAAIVSFLQQRGVLHNPRIYVTCENPMTLNFVKRMTDGSVPHVVVVQRYGSKRALD